MGDGETVKNGRIAMETILRLTVYTLALALAGCATATTAKFREHVNKWIGAPEKALIVSWGVPTKTMDLGDGSHVDEYVRAGTPTLGQAALAGMASQSYTSGNIDPSGNFEATTTPGVIVRFYCTTDFYIDHLRTIKRVSWRGNGCHSK